MGGEGLLDCTAAVWDTRGPGRRPLLLPTCCCPWRPAEVPVAVVVVGQRKPSAMKSQTILLE